MKTKETEHTAEHKPYNGRLTIYHANSKGTGAAARLELSLCRNGNGDDSCFFLEMAKQKTAPSQADRKRTPATFDWEGKAVVKLGFTDVCEMLTVLEGRQDQAGGRRNGLYHSVGKANAIITFKRNTERGGYLLAISRKDADGNQVFKGHIILSETECTGLRSIFQAGLFHMAFHSSLRK